MRDDDTVCGERCTGCSYICTREPGHDGPHSCIPCSRRSARWDRELFRAHLDIGVQTMAEPPHNAPLGELVEELRTYAALLEHRAREVTIAPDPFLGPGTRWPRRETERSR